MSFRRICKDFLGNHKAANCQDVVQDLLTSYRALGYNLSPKNYFLESYLDFFPENLGEVGDEHGERFHQDFMTTEKRYGGRWTSCMLAGYCWKMQTDVPDAKCQRKSIQLYILGGRFCGFHEQVKYYFAHLNSLVSLKAYLIENNCIRI